MSETCTRCVGQSLPDTDMFISLPESAASHLASCGQECRPTGASLPAASLASHTALLANAGPLPMNAISGRNSIASLANSGPTGYWLKMYRGCFQARLDG